MMTKDTADTPPQPAAVGAQVQRSVRPCAWWRLSTLPECGPCATTDPEEANEWRAQGLDVRELREPSVLVGELRDALRASHQSLEFMQMLYESDLRELQDDSVRALREALARGEAALAKLPAF